MDDLDDSDDGWGAPATPAAERPELEGRVRWIFAAQEVKKEPFALRAIALFTSDLVIPRRQVQAAVSAWRRCIAPVPRLPRAPRRAQRRREGEERSLSSSRHLSACRSHLETGTNLL